MDEQKKPLGITPTDEEQNATTVPQSGAPEVSVDFNQESTPGDGPTVSADGSLNPPAADDTPSLAPETPADSDTTSSDTTPNVVFGADSQLPPTGQPTDSTAVSPVATPPPVTDTFGSDTPAASPDTSTPSVFPPQDTASQPLDSASTGIQPNPADSPVPQTAPVASAASDKKTIVILAVVAVVLIAAIAVLFFM